MKKILFLLMFFSIFGKSFGQNVPKNEISKEDKILLREFWIKFSDAVQKNDKKKFAEISNFPFNCRPCIDENIFKDKDLPTIKVTKNLFFSKNFKADFIKQMQKDLKKDKSFRIFIFHKSTDENGNIIKDEYNFLYTIVAPSKNWEGSQGLVYLKKINDKIKIVGIDTIP